MAERYIKENGSEALEKFVASKSKGEKTNNDVELIKAVANTEKKVVTTIQMDSRDNPAVAKGLNCKEPIVARKHRKRVQLAEKNAAATAIRQVKCAEPNLDKRTVADVEIKEMTAESSAHRENKLLEITTASVTNLPNPNHHCSQMYELFHVDFHEFHYETCVTSHPFVVANWAKMVMQHAVSFPETKTLVGLAISWTPRADPQKVPQPSLLQLCFGNTCIIFELWRECYYPQELKDLFDCNQIYFVGIDIEKTQGYLYANTKILISNIVDFRDWAATEGVIPRDAISRWNMTGMVARLLERHYEKPEDVIRSAWNQPLTNQQVFYASLNAFLSFQLERKVCPWM